jgi:hypothetical protein
MLLFAQIAGREQTFAQIATFAQTATYVQQGYYYHFSKDVLKYIFY